MDPQACWQRYLDACADKDMSRDDNDVERYLAVADLQSWYRHGGGHVCNITLPLLTHIMCDIYARMSPDAMEMAR